MLHERKPDIFFCEGADITHSIMNALQQFPNTKLVVVNPRPDFRQPANKCFTCYTNEPKSKIEGLEILKPSANNVQFHSGKYTEELSSDVLIYTNNDSVVDYRIIGLLTQDSPKYRIKVFGKNRMTIPYYLGDLNLQEASNAMASTKVAVDFGDNYVTYAYNKVCTITHFQNPYWHTTSYESYLETLDKLVSEDKLRKKLIKTAFKACDGNTIIDRAKYILQKLGYTE